MHRPRDADLAAELHGLAWGYVRKVIPGAAGGPPGARGHEMAPSTGNLQRSYLELLRVYSAMQEALTANAAYAQGMAHSAGASYTAIADARGVSRQAVRQQWIKQRSTQIVTLEGGPRDGEEVRVLHGEELTIWIGRHEWTEIDGSKFRGATVRYGQSKVDRDRFVLVDVRREILQDHERLQDAMDAHYKKHPYPSEIAESQERPRVRVHELARQVRLPTKVVLGRLAAMGVLSKTASSTVENTVAAVIQRAVYRTSDWD